MLLPCGVVRLYFQICLSKCPSWQAFGSQNCPCIGFAGVDGTAMVRVGEHYVAYPGPCSGIVFPVSTPGFERIHSHDSSIHTHTHTHTRICIYIYIHILMHIRLNSAFFDFQVVRSCNCSAGTRWRISPLSDSQEHQRHLIKLWGQSKTISWYLYHPIFMYFVKRWYLILKFKVSSSAPRKFEVSWAAAAQPGMMISILKAVARRGDAGNAKCIWNKMQNAKCGWHYIALVSWHHDGICFHHFLTEWYLDSSWCILMAEFLSQGQMPGKGKGWCKQPWLFVSTGFVQFRSVLLISLPFSNI